MEQKSLVKFVLRNPEAIRQQLVQPVVELPEGFVLFRGKPENVSVLFGISNPNGKGTLRRQKSGQFFQNGFVFFGFKADFQYRKILRVKPLKIRYGF